MLKRHLVYYLNRNEYIYVQNKSQNIGLTIPGNWSFEIRRISPLKSGRFHPWNPADFTLKSGGFHPWNPADFTLEIGGFHPWNLVDFTLKSSRFHPEIRQISPLKSGRFHPWNLADFTHEIWQISPWNLVDFTQISPVKSTQNYKSKCFSKNSSVWWMQGGGFHPRNLVDFTLKSGGFHPDFTCEIHPKL